MLRYICLSRGLEERFYSKDLKTRALIDCYLDWHHTNTRKCAILIFDKVLGPKLGVKPTANL
jgi:glutathione S-transferase